MVRAGLLLNRITPACAGRRKAEDLLLLATQDHPRVCGEKMVSGSFALYRPGSPPRVRGEGAVHLSHHIHTGITPACAGRRS